MSILIALVLAIGSAPLAGAVRSENVDGRLCSFPDQRDALSSSEPVGRNADPGEPFQWFTSGAGADSNQQLVDALSNDPHVVGIVPELVSGRMYVVVDIGSLDRVRGQIAALNLSFNVEVHASCYQREELERVSSEIVAISEQLNREGLNFVATIEPRIGRVLVVTDPRSEGYEAGSRVLRARFGDRVELVDGDLGEGRDGRFDDSSPHYGAASFGVTAPNTQHCTGNAPIVGIYGIRFMVTAGHCYTTTNANTWSGPYGYGRMAARDGDFPYHDLAILSPYSDFGEYFTNRIHTDPGLPVSRGVNAAADSSLNQSVCISGATSLANCTLIVNSTNLTLSLCDSYGCTYGWHQAYTPLAAGVPCNAGDSGGAIYSRTGTDGATIRGVYWKHIDVAAYGVRNCYFHPPSVVQSHWGNYLLVP